MPKKLNRVLSVFLLVIIFSCMFTMTACSKKSKFSLVSFVVGSSDYSNLYDYNYIELNEKDNTYIIENKTKTNSIVTKQTGSYIVDQNGKVTVTNNEIPSSPFWMCFGEEIYLIGDTIKITGDIVYLGYSEMVFRKK